jgi:DAACS family dicarboxylate/amino acid:cation (Na+ or H+) symporter
VASTFSVLIGVGIVNIFKPGVSANLAQLFSQADQTQVMKIQESVSQTKSIKNTLLDMLPSNPVSAAANAMNGEMLALMVFTLIFGIAYASYHKQNPEKKPVLIPILENIYATTMIIVEYALKLAPIAVFSIIFNTSFKLGPYFLSSVFFYVFCVVLGLLIQQFVVYSILLKVFTKISPLDFFRKCKDVYLYAFSTASSNATLPEALETAEHKLKLSPRVSRFVLTVGATANQNGTALFEGVTVLFLAQVYGVDLSISSQFLVIITCILAGIGTAGVPGGSLPVIMILLGSIGVPPQAIGIILGVDRFLDMCRTTLNVSGDLVIAALVDE